MKLSREAGINKRENTYRSFVILKWWVSNLGSGSSNDIMKEVLLDWFV
ncbi:hypothetical protein [Lysinibacillus parviboronicapiens]|nr:hypothetical protein [Lysinibacillus parviboronicapiens]